MRRAIVICVDPGRLGGVLRRCAMAVGGRRGALGASGGAVPWGLVIHVMSLPLVRTFASLESR